MISAKEFFDVINHQGIEFFSGIPDSLLKDICAFLTDYVAPSNHIIAANEGNAIALASGWYLGTGKPAMVYLQNSGLGNCVNPLTSLADPEVYGIPMLLVVGWRGEPGRKDEPQHTKQGRITRHLLETLEIQNYVIGSGTPDICAVVIEACKSMAEHSRPVCLIVEAGTFEDYISLHDAEEEYEISREDAIKEIVDSIGPDELLVTTTGKASRELFEYRTSRGEPIDHDFLTVGSMGHTSSIAMGLAVARPEKRILCLDGDGSAIMHLGAMAIIGQSGLNNIVHAILNNGAHDSVGGQPTVGLSISFEEIARACGYDWAITVDNLQQIHDSIETSKIANGPVLIDIRLRRGARPDLGRPGVTPIENKRAFMDNMKRSS